jgi:catalase
MENSPAVLFDAVVLPDNRKAVQALLGDGHTLEFVKDQYRHCKTIMVPAAATQILDRCGISATLPSGTADPGLIGAAAGKAGGTQRFVEAVGKHRHPERDSDPPLV